MTTIQDQQFYGKNNYHFDFESSKYDKDRKLYDRIISEAYNHNGVSMQYYIVTFDTSYDKIFGEDNDRCAERKFDIMTYYDLPKEEELWSKFGIEGIDNFHMYISKKTFEVESTTGITVSGGSTKQYDIYDSYIPRAGDIIKAAYNDYYYEVIDVHNTTEIFLQGYHSWDLIVQPFKDESLDSSATLSGDDLTNYISQDDILNISGAIDEEKGDILYDPSSTEEDAYDGLAGW